MMGIRPPVVALYRQMKQFGLFDGVSSVMELGAQNVRCPQTNMMRDLYDSFDRSPPSEETLSAYANWVNTGRQ